MFLVMVTRKPACLDVSDSDDISHTTSVVVLMMSQQVTTARPITRHKTCSFLFRRSVNITNDLESLKFVKKYHQTNSSLGFLFPYG